MKEAGFLLSLFTISLSSMDLALAIVWSERACYKWSRALVIFASSVLGLVFSYALASFQSLFFQGTVSYIIESIWMGLFMLTGAFLFVFSPIFVNFVVARPMSSLEKMLFILMGLLFLAMGILNLVFSLDILTAIAFLEMMILILYIAVVMGFSFFRIKDRTIRTVSLTLMIVSLSVLPFMAASLMFPFVRSVLLQVVALSYFITLLVFLFAANYRETKRDKKSSEETMTEKKNVYADYHITDREMEIINLIKKGLTNKAIASELGISVNTVNNHIANIFGKTGVSCRIDLLNLLSEASW